MLFSHWDIYPIIRRQCQAQRFGESNTTCILYVYIPRGRPLLDLNVPHLSKAVPEKILKVIVRECFEPYSTDLAVRITQGFDELTSCFLESAGDRLTTQAARDEYREQIHNLLMNPGSLTDWQRLPRTAEKERTEYDDISQIRNQALQKFAERTLKNPSAVQSLNCFPDEELEKQIVEQTFHHPSFVATVVDRYLSSHGFSDYSQPKLKKVIIEHLLSRARESGDILQTLFAQAKASIARLFEYRPRESPCHWVWPQAVVVIERHMVRGWTKICGYLHTDDDPAFNTHREDSAGGIIHGEIGRLSTMLPVPDAHSDEKYFVGSGDKPYLDIVRSDADDSGVTRASIGELVRGSTSGVQEFGFVEYEPPITIGQLGNAYKLGHIVLKRVAHTQIEEPNARQIHKLDPLKLNLLGYPAGFEPRALQKLGLSSSELKRVNSLFGAFQGLPNDPTYKPNDKALLQRLMSQYGTACFKYNRDKMRWEVLNLDPDGRFIYLRYSISGTHGWPVSNDWYELPSRCFMFVEEIVADQGEAIVFEIDIGSVGAALEESSKTTIVLEDMDVYSAEDAVLWMERRGFQEVSRCGVKAPPLYRALLDGRWHYVKFPTGEILTREAQVISILRQVSLLRPPEVRVEDQKAVVSPELQSYNPPAVEMSEPCRLLFLELLTKYIVKINEAGLVWMDVAFEHILRHPDNGKMCIIDCAGFLTRDEFEDKNIRRKLSMIKRPELFLPEEFLDVPISADKVQSFLLGQLVVRLMSGEDRGFDHNKLGHYLRNEQLESYEKALAEELAYLHCPEWIRPAIATNPSDRPSPNGVVAAIATRLKALSDFDSDVECPQLREQLQ